MSDLVGFGLIGCGEIAVQTSKAMLACAKARVVHCMDVREDLAKDLAAAHQAKTTAKLETLLADPDVRAVVISTPHYLHAPLAVQAAQAGKHVLVEKPLACTLGQADEMLAAAAQANVKLGVMHVQRLGFQQTKARAMIAGGAIGQVVSVKLHSMANKPLHYWTGGYTGRAPDPWRTSQQKSGGGMLIMNLIHNLDTLVALLDPRPQRIYAEYGTFLTRTEVEDYISFVMRCHDGSLITLDAASAAVGGESLGDRYYGQTGQIAIAGRELKVYLNRPWEDLETGKWVTIPAPADWPNPRTACVDGFADAVLEGGEPPISGAQARRALEIVRGAYLSMQRGVPVTFPVVE